MNNVILCSLADVITFWPYWHLACLPIGPEWTKHSETPCILNIIKWHNAFIIEIVFRVIHKKQRLSVQQEKWVPWDVISKGFQQGWYSTDILLCTITEDTCRRIFNEQPLLQLIFREFRLINPAESNNPAHICNELFYP